MFSKILDNRTARLYCSEYAMKFSGHMVIRDTQSRRQARSVLERALQTLNNYETYYVSTKK